MRLCPRDKSPEGKFSVTQFEDKCYLSEETEPGSGHLKWAMRWRGEQSCGWGGVISGIIRFCRVKINLLMIYRQFFIFDTSEIGELDINTKVQPLERS